MPQRGAAFDVIIVGGGVAGASTAMQLALRGSRVLVLERQMLGAGSTGRAAGLLGQLRSTKAAVTLLRDGLGIVRDIERRTGTEIFVQTGSMRIAATPDRVREIEEHVRLAHEVDLPIEELDRAEVARCLPYMKTDDLLAACYCPTDGHLQPAELLAGYVRVARDHGATFQTQTPVERAIVTGGRVQGVVAGGVEYHAPVVVNCTGPWSYLVAEKAETRLATAAIGHYYLTTTPSPEVPVDRHSPAVRDRANRIYTRPEAGGLLVGMYEAEPVEYDMERLPPDFDMSQMRARRDELNVAILIDAASRRFPFINERTAMSITTGIMTFTPDGQPCCGPSSEIEGLFHCAGFCGHGIVQSPAIGLVMSQLILDGRSTYDVQALAAGRFDDLIDLADRPAIKAASYRTYSNYYGKVATTDAAKT
ncbi:MAG: FAD-binding oxidoreductase [Pirellulales bacterium]|nr:FAD-binding oxidoreductase [Pirellulales bacterium]